MPLVGNIEAEFKSDNAKLIWPVSLDGKKMESETYKIGHPGQPKGQLNATEEYPHRSSG